MNDALDPRPESYGHAAAIMRMMEAHDEHSASRRVDVLAVEAPDLLAPDAVRRELAIVVSLDGDEPRLLGTFAEQYRGGVWFWTPDGRYRHAAEDRVEVVKVAL